MNKRFMKIMVRRLLDSATHLKNAKGAKQMRAKLILGAFALTAAAPVSAALITWNSNPFHPSGPVG